MAIGFTLAGKYKSIFVAIPVAGSSAIWFHRARGEATRTATNRERRAARRHDFPLGEHGELTVYGGVRTCTATSRSTAACGSTHPARLSGIPST
jgi:hypothetical protein